MFILLLVYLVRLVVTWTILPTVKYLPIPWVCVSPSSPSVWVFWLGISRSTLPYGQLFVLVLTTAAPTILVCTNRELSVRLFRGHLVAFYFIYDAALLILGFLRNALPAARPTLLVRLQGSLAAAVDYAWVFYWWIVQSASISARQLGFLGSNDSSCPLVSSSVFDTAAVYWRGVASCCLKGAAKYGLLSRLKQVSAGAKEELRNEVGQYSVHGRYDLVFSILGVGVEMQDCKRNHFAFGEPETSPRVGCLPSAASCRPFALIRKVAPGPVVECQAPSSPLGAIIICSRGEQYPAGRLEEIPDTVSPTGHGLKTLVRVVWSSDSKAARLSSEHLKPNTLPFDTSGGVDEYDVIDLVSHFSRLSLEDTESKPGRSMCSRCPLRNGGGCTGAAPGQTPGFAKLSSSLDALQLRPLHPQDDSGSDWDWADSEASSESDSYSEADDDWFYRR